MAKKEYTKSTNNAADKFFSQSEKISENTYVTEDNTISVNNGTHISDNLKQSYYGIITNSTHVIKQSKVTNKSKHYDKRGKRSERYGLLMDSQLKDDLRLLSNAMGSKSVNDFIITILLDYVERTDNQIKLEQYRKLIEG